MTNTKTVHKEQLLSSVKPSRAIVTLAVPATIALLAKAVYNIVDTAFIGMLHSETALAAVGVTLPLLLIFVSIENIFAAGAAVLAGRQLGAGDKDGANTTVSTIVGISVVTGAVLCILGILFMEPLLRVFGASDAVMPQAKEYALWMFVAAIANLPAQSLNCAARAESSVKITTIAITIGAVLNIILDPIFIFDWGLGLGVAGASIATTISQFATAAILFWYYLSGRSIIKLKRKAIRPTTQLFKTVVAIGIPSAIIQICLAVATSLTNMVAAGMPEGDLMIAAYGVVQRLVLIGIYIIMGFMQGYQPVASYAFGAKNEERFHECVRFSLKASLLLSALIAILYIPLSKPLLLLFNRNPAVVEYGSRLLISQVALYPAFGLCYMMTITFQTIGASKFGLFLSAIRQGIFYSLFILLLPGFFGVTGVYLAQPLADVLTILVCLFSYAPLKRIASETMGAQETKRHGDATSKREQLCS